MAKAKQTCAVEPSGQLEPQTGPTSANDFPLWCRTHDVHWYDDDEDEKECPVGVAAVTA